MNPTQEQQEQHTNGNRVSNVPIGANANTGVQMQFRPPVPIQFQLQQHPIMPRNMPAPTQPPAFQVQSGQPQQPQAHIINYPVGQPLLSAPSTSSSQPLQTMNQYPAYNIVHFPPTAIRPANLPNSISFINQDWRPILSAPGTSLVSPPSIIKPQISASSASGVPAALSVISEPFHPNSINQSFHTNTNNTSVPILPLPNTVMPPIHVSSMAGKAPLPHISSPKKRTSKKQPVKKPTRKSVYELQFMEEEAKKQYLKAELVELVAEQEYILTEIERYRVRNHLLLDIIMNAEHRHQRSLHRSNLAHN